MAQYILFCSYLQILLKGLVNEEKYSEAGILMRQALQKARGER